MRDFLLLSQSLVYDSERDAFYLCNEATGHQPAGSSAITSVFQKLQASVAQTLHIQCAKYVDGLPIYKPVAPPSDATCALIAQLISLTPLPPPQLKPSALTDSCAASPSRRIDSAGIVGVDKPSIQQQRPEDAIRMQPPSAHVLLSTSARTHCLLPVAEQREMTKTMHLQQRSLNSITLTYRASESRSSTTLQFRKSYVFVAFVS